jgi:hypothetical protein
MKTPPRPRLLLLAAGTVALAAHGIGCWTPPVHVYPAVSVADPAAAAPRYRDQACTLAAGSDDGRGDPDHCGPFPCAGGHCQVSTCDPTSATACFPGVCAGGYCLSAAPVGARACEATKPKDEAETLFRGGCRCVPESASAPRDRDVCGSLPCGLHGCYVQPCHGDRDCAYGICSGHASAPHGYCVTDDPY